VKHASDATSVAVRASAVNAIAHILETPSSHAILRELLPPLGNLIHDKAEKVRLAVVKLLQRIKKVPNIKYYKVVSVNHLMARLVAEPPKKKANNNNSVVAGLTGLMVNSFAPENADVEQLVGRTQKFLIDYPRAAPTFYANLKKFRSSSFICQLVVGLYHCLCFELQAHQKAVEKRRSKGGKRSRIEENPTFEVDKNVNLVQCGTLVNVILVLWTSIKADLDQSVEWSDFVASEVEGKSLLDMVSCFDDLAVMALPNDEEEDDDGDEVGRKDICNHSSRLLLQCAALLPRAAVDSLAKELPSTSGASQSPAYFALMSVWGAVIGDELAASIAAAFGDDSMILPARDGLRSKKKRLGGKSKSPGLKMDPLRAVRIVSAILKADDPSSNTARDSLVHCDSLLDSLRKASEYALCVVSGNMVSVRLSSRRHDQLTHMFLFLG
jgi:condensin-2 complex subunit G2